MNLSSFEFSLFSVAGVLAVSLGFFGIMANFVYDLRALRQKRTQQKHPFAKSARRRPLISVSVYSENDAAHIIRCLDSVVKSSYRKVELIVIDNASSDDTAAMVRRYVAEHPKKRIRLIVKKKRGSVGGCLRYANQRWSKGEFTLGITAKDALEPATLKLGMNHFTHQPTLSGVIASWRPETEYALRSFWRHFSAAAVNWLNKAGFGVSSGEVGILRAQGRQEHHTVYAQDVIIRQSLPSVPLVSRRKFINPLHREGKRTFTSNALFYLLALLICVQPLLVPYLLYMALSFSSILYLLADLSVSAVLMLVVIWSDGYLGIADKIMLSINMPFLYGAFLALCVWLLFVTCLSAARKAAFFAANGLGHQFSRLKLTLSLTSS